jgi:hypothetical protein
MAPAWAAAIARSVCSSGVPGARRRSAMNSPCDNCGISSLPRRGTSAAVASSTPSEISSTRPRFTSDQASVGWYTRASAAKPDWVQRAGQAMAQAAPRDTQAKSRRTAADAAPIARPMRPGGRLASGGRGTSLPAASIGTSVMATTSENTSAKLTVSAWSRNSWPAMPVMNTIGKNTATEVSVAAVIAVPTSLVPRRAASTRDLPASRWRTMFSSTTTALSTSMPTASAMPPSDMMLSDRSNRCISMNVPITDTGIARPMISVARASRRNRYSTRIASRPPMIAASRTSPMAEEMKRDWSYTSSSSLPAGSDLPSSSIRARRPSASCTVLASPSL